PEQLAVVAHLGHRARLEGVVGLRHFVGRLREVALQVVVAVLQALGNPDFLAALRPRRGRLLREGRHCDEEERRRRYRQEPRTFHYFAPCGRKSLALDCTSRRYGWQSAP